MINAKASNWVDRGEPPEPTLGRVLASYLELSSIDHAALLREYASTIRSVAEADATEVHVAGYLRTLEAKHLAAEHSARGRRGMGIALWHIAKAAAVRDRAMRLRAEHAAATPGRHRCRSRPGWRSGCCAMTRTSESSVVARARVRRRRAADLHFVRPCPSSRRKLPLAAGGRSVL